MLTSKIGINPPPFLFSIGINFLRKDLLFDFHVCLWLFHFASSSFKFINAFSYSHFYKIYTV